MAHGQPDGPGLPVCVAQVFQNGGPFRPVPTYGNKKLKKREFVGLCFVSIVMLCAITYAFFADFGSY